MQSKKGNIHGDTVSGASCEDSRMARQSQPQKEVYLTPECSLNARMLQPVQLSQYRKTTQVPSSDNYILQVTGPSSQTWQPDTQWKKQVGMRRETERGRTTKFSQLKLQTQFSVNGFGFKPILNSTTNSFNFDTKKVPCDAVLGYQNVSESDQFKFYLLPTCQ